MTQNNNNIQEHYLHWRHENLNSGITENKIIKTIPLLPQNNIWCNKETPRLSIPLTNRDAYAAVLR